MQYTLSELELTYLVDLLADIQTEVTDDTLDEVAQAIDMINGVIHEQTISAINNITGDGAVGGDTTGSEGRDRHFESGQLTLPASGVTSK